MKTVICRSKPTCTAEVNKSAYFSRRAALKVTYLGRYDELWNVPTPYYIARKLYSMLLGRTVAVRVTIGAYGSHIFRCTGLPGSTNNCLQLCL